MRDVVADSTGAKWSSLARAPAWFPEITFRSRSPNCGSEASCLPTKAALAARESTCRVEYA